MRPLAVSAPQEGYQRGIYAAVVAARGTILISVNRPEAAIAQLESAKSILAIRGHRQTERSSSTMVSLHFFFVRLGALTAF